MLQAVHAVAVVPLWLWKLPSGQVRQSWTRLVALQLMDLTYVPTQHDAVHGLHDRVDVH